MNISLTTPSTLIFGIWYQNGICAVKGAYRTIDSELTPNVYQNYGDDPWQILCESIEDCRPMRIPNLMMVCNDSEMVKMFTRPIRLPVKSVKKITIPMMGWSNEPTIIHDQTGTRSARDLKRVSKTSAYDAETIDEVDIHLWKFARLLMRFEKWRMIHAETIPATYTYWQECQAQPAIFQITENPFG